MSKPQNLDSWLINMIAGDLNVTSAMVEDSGKANQLIQKYIKGEIYEYTDLLLQVGTLYRKAGQ